MEDALSDGGQDRRELGWMVTLGGVVLVGLGVVVVFGLQFAPGGGGGRVATTGLLVAGACLLIGGLVGFLFGIPRTLQEPAAGGGGEPAAAAAAAGEGEGRTPPAKVRYQVNTNLEQISDWLTKILVGVGLTQLTSVPERLSNLAAYLGPAFGGEAANGDRFAVAVVLYFLTTGFLFGYLWTRLFLAGALARADLSVVLRRVEKKIEKQTEVDARALSLTYRYLDPKTEPKEVPIEDLKRAIQEASPNVKVQIFYQAQTVRSENWERAETKPLMERTIPIFQALIASDKEERFHKNYGQLGFALKDKREPDWKEAEAALSKAIKLRGDPQREGWQLYEFVRAVCHIMVDPRFAAKKASSPEDRAKVLADLRVAAWVDWLRDLMDQPPIADWRKLNKVGDAELEEEAEGSS